MKTLFALLALIATAAFAQHHDHDTQVAGKWQISMDTPHGAMNGPMTIEQDGSKLTVKIEMEHTGTLNLSGKIEGNSISLDMQRGEMSMKLNGTLNGNKMEGTMSPQGGAWSATRQ